jgi:serine/threonine-protein kinase RsbW
MSMPLTDTGHDLDEDRRAMCWRRTFRGQAEQARSARDFVAFLLTGCAYADDAITAVGELVANALRHTRSALPGGLFTIEVRRWRSGMSVGVTDQGGASEPVVREPGAMAESGRGLKTVAAVASRWDWTGDADSRTVIVIFDTTDVAP